jgi:hypothetical protein
MRPSLLGKKLAILSPLEMSDTTFDLAFLAGFRIRRPERLDTDACQPRPSDFLGSSKHL